MGYREVILADSPVGYWRLGETSGSTANDETGAGRHGTHTNVTVNQTSLLAGDSDPCALYTRASSSRTSMGDNAAFTPGSAWTVEAWIKLASYSGGQNHFVVSKGHASHYEWEFLVDGSQKLQFTLYSSLGGIELYRAIGATTINVGTTYHVVGVYESGVSARVYIDTVLDGTDSTGSGTVQNGAAELFIGTRNASESHYFDGYIDEVAIYAAALTPAQISAHYAASQWGGQAAGAASASADLTTDIRLSGAAAAQAAASPDLTVLAPIFGAAEAAASASGELFDVIFAPISLDVSDLTAVLAAPIKIAVSESGTITADISIVVSAAAPLAGAASAQAEAEGALGEPLYTATLSVPIRMAVHSPATFETATDWDRWRPSVVIGPADEEEDISARLVGEVTIEMEESTARIATLSLSPVAGPWTLAQWIGKRIAIDYGKQEPDGSITDAQRLFTGVIELPEYDPVTRITRLSCTDALQERISRLERDQIDALIGGTWSSGVFTDDGDNWRYAADQLRTVSASLDCDAWGAFRVTAWAALPTPDFEFLEADLEETSLAVQWAERTQLRNRIVVSLRYRYPRAKVRAIGSTYTYPYGLDAIILNGYSLPTRAMIEQALRGTGWELSDDISWVPVPAGPLLISVNGRGVIWITSDDDLTGTTTIGGEQRYNVAFAAPSQAVADQLCLGYAARLKRRYVQSIEEAYSLTVEHAGSIEAFGPIEEAITGALESEWSGASAWENWRPPELPAWSEPSPDQQEPEPVITAPAIGEAAEDYLPDAQSDRTAAAAAGACLIQLAQTRIRATHRAHRVRARTWLRPTLDLVHTVSLTSSRVIATGKIARLRHILSLESGRAATEFELAISATAGDSGSDAAATLPEAPAYAAPELERPVDAFLTHVGSVIGAGPIQADWTGFFMNAKRGAPAYDASATVYPVQFVVETPEIDAASRDNASVALAQAYTVEIPIDSFTVAA